MFIHNITLGPFSQEHEIVTTKSALVRKIQVKWFPSTAWENGSRGHSS